MSGVGGVLSEGGLGDELMEERERVYLFVKELKAFSFEVLDPL